MSWPTVTNGWIIRANKKKKIVLAESLGSSDLTNEHRLKISPTLESTFFFLVAFYLQVNELRGCYKLQRKIEISTNWVYLYVNVAACRTVIGDIKLCL